jgi:hypothetical protein
MAFSHKHVKNMDNMICKGWENIRLLRSFNEQFQLETMEVNAIKILFSINFDSKIKQHEDDDDNIDLENSMFEIME